MKNENIDEKLNKGVAELKNIRMTPKEKSRILHRIVSVQKSPYLQRSSYFSLSSFVATIQRGRLSHYLVVGCIVVVISGGGVSFASIGSLPGNALYGVKVHIVEPLS